jgi:hypothetical protein
MRQDSETGISLWLYRVTRNEHLLNHPPPRPAPNQVARHPIPIDLHYLITPLLNDPLDEQEMLGLVLQSFNDHPILRGPDLQGDLQGSDEELRISLETLSLEDHSRIWSALQEPFQASLTYLVQVVCIDSLLEPRQVAPVLTRESTTSQILSSE